MICKTGGNLVKRRQITKFTLRSWCNLVKWPYGVKKISIQWLLPVKVTLEVIKRHPKVFCWSCDEDPLKWDKKNLRSIQFVITERMNLYSPLSSNGRSIPLIRTKTTTDMCICRWTDTFGLNCVRGNFSHREIRGMKCEVWTTFRHNLFLLFWWIICYMASETYSVHKRTKRCSLNSSQTSPFFVSPKGYLNKGKSC